MRPLPAVGAIWADATKGLPVDNVDDWRAAWCHTCRHNADACPLSGVLDTGYTPAQITSTIEDGTRCSHHSPTGQPDEPVSPPAMPLTGTGREQSGPGAVPFHDARHTHVPVPGNDPGDPEMAPSDQIPGP